MRLSFDTLIGRSNTEVFMPALLIKYRIQHSTENAIILYVQEINFRRDNLVARSSSAHVNIAKFMYKLFEYKTKYQREGIAKIISMLFQAIAIFRLYVDKI